MGLCIAGTQIDDPISVWREYAHARPQTIREYDLCDHGDPDHVTCAESWRSRIINSRLTKDECEQFVSRAAEPDCPWRGVPADSDLYHADPAVPGGLFDKAAELYWYFTWPVRIDGVRVAKVHKILHIKRPALYPILDDKLRRLYRSQAEPWVTELSRLDVTIEDSPPYWAAIRQDLLCNSERIAAYRQALAADPDETVTLMSYLTDLRLQDIVAWHVAG